MTKTTSTYLNVAYAVSSRFAIVDGEPGISCSLTIALVAQGERFYSFAEHVEVNSDVALDWAAEEAQWLIDRSKMAHRTYVEHEFGVCLQHIPEARQYVYDDVRGVRVAVR
jgi:hypothetical protein